ncbi:chemotaxis protein [Chelativorans sp. Marseille-P2723]|uniref:chemotaxis protein n=1 Tax=Chelativorans sp. Marseille-P2723 TaxID=2709133 RepID=UPI001FF002C9|nr:chemotaxis protein [Chelativorans sp. Marseille-P2723]
MAAIAGLLTPAAAAGLEPYQMIRSLQLMQDRIADGDHAALPMQSRLLAIVDRRLRDMAPEKFEDRRNLDALLIYGASGGNPETLEAVFSRLQPGEADRRLNEGLTHYARGDLAAARELLASVDLDTMEPRLAAPLALVLGSLFTQQDPAEALRLFDQARLLSPGTLIEEAALRRSVAVSAEMKDEERFARASIQYVNRFLRSPYANQFAEAFVSGIIAFEGQVDLSMVEEVASNMRPDQAQVIYLRIARQSAIEGYHRLLAFASENAEKYAAEEQEDPRATLYANLALVASANVDAVLGTLEKIDDERLSESDRKLLRAARKIAGDILASPVEGLQDGSMPAASELFRGAAAEGQTAIERFMAKSHQKLKEIDMLLAEKRR